MQRHPSLFGDVRTGKVERHQPTQRRIISQHVIEQRPAEHVERIQTLRFRPAAVPLRDFREREWRRPPIQVPVEPAMTEEQYQGIATARTSMLEATRPGARDVGDGWSHSTTPDFVSRQSPWPATTQQPDFQPLTPHIDTHAPFTTQFTPLTPHFDTPAAHFPPPTRHLDTPVVQFQQPAPHFHTPSPEFQPPTTHFQPPTPQPPVVVGALRVTEKLLETSPQNVETSRAVRSDRHTVKEEPRQHWLLLVALLVAVGVLLVMFFR